MLACLSFNALMAQTGKPANDVLKYHFNETGSHYFLATFLNQTWLRYNQSNPGTTVEGQLAKETFDIGLRRTRIQMFGQLNDKTFIYFQFGMNNFNSQFNTNPPNNRKLASFFHDAVCEYKVSRDASLKLGGGLTITNGLSRFSQPSIGTIMTMDVPVFAQATVDQTDEFSRKLSIYARGQISKLDYRISLSDPFPIQSSGNALPALGKYANFAQVGHHKQYQTMLSWNFWEMEPHTTPYMTGTYLGTKKIWNVSAGAIFQPKATWTRNTSGGSDSANFHDMMLWCVESFLDMPLNKEKGSALSAYAGYFNYNFGPDYLRYNGIMNPANGNIATNSIAGAGTGVFGNAFPMMGTGQIIYTQAGILLPEKFLGSSNGKLMPYASFTYANFHRLQNHPMEVYHAGVNWLIQGHRSKISLDWENRPTFTEDTGGTINKGSRKSSIVLQYQIFI